MSEGDVTFFLWSLAVVELLFLKVGAFYFFVCPIGVSMLLASEIYDAKRKTREIITMSFLYF